MVFFIAPEWLLNRMEIHSFVEKWAGELRNSWGKHFFVCYGAFKSLPLSLHDQCMTIYITYSKAEYPIYVTYFFICLGFWMKVHASMCVSVHMHIIYASVNECLCVCICLVMRSIIGNPSLIHSQSHYHCLCMLTIFAIIPIAFLCSLY